MMEKTVKRLRVLALFTFFISPIFVWGSVSVSDETAVFASLSRMIWFTGSSFGILVAMLVLFIPMLSAFFMAHDMSDLTKGRKLLLRISMIASCVILYVGAMWVMPSDGKTMTTENILHGIMSFGGMLMIFLTYCCYAAFVLRKDRDGSILLVPFLFFSLITGAFAVINVFDAKSYVIASAASELYVLNMMSLIGYLTYYLAYRRKKAENNSYNGD